MKRYWLLCTECAESAHWPEYSNKCILLVAYIQAHLQYGVMFWSNSPTAFSTFQIQKRAVRMINGNIARDSWKPIFRELEILLLPSLYLLETIKSIKDHVMPNDCGLEKNNDIHEHGTRSKSKLSFVTYCHPTT